MKKLSLVAALLAATTAYAAPTSSGSDVITNGTAQVGTSAVADQGIYKSAHPDDAAATTDNNLVGTLTVNGRISSQTCEIKAGSKDIVVNLAHVPSATFKKAGQVAGWQPFSITLSGCNAGGVAEDDKTKTVFANFTPTAAQLEGDDYEVFGLLKNLSDDSPAQGVAIQLTNSDYATEINLNANAAKAFVASATGTPQKVFEPNDTILGVTIDDTVTTTSDVVLKYGAQYYAIADTVTPGNVTANTAYSIAYR